MVPPAPPHDHWSDQEALQSATEELARVGSWQWDIRKDLIQWSRELYRILGYPPETIPTQKLWFSRIHPDDMPRLLEENVFSMGEGRPHPAEFRILRSGGEERWVRMTAKTKLIESVPVYMCGVIVDITEQRNLERQLRQAQKMESLGRLAGGVAHDFNNILTVIRASLELLERKHDPRALAAIDKATTLATELTAQLLTFSSPGPDKSELLNVNEAMESALAFVSRLLGGHTGMCFIPGENLPKIFASQSQLERALMNLAANARDAMAPGGIVTIRTERREPVLRVEGTLSAPEAVLVVEDTGSGMSEAVRSRAFDPFFTTKRDGGGTGLGLAVVQEIVTGLGGQLEIASEVGKGTKICLRFPGQLAESASPERRELLTPTRPLQLILVDDNQDLLGPVAAGLIRAGHSTRTFAHPAEALEFFNANAASCDVLITDMMMGETTGLELLEKVRRNYPLLPAVLTSGYFSSWTGQLPNRTALLAKPFSGEELLDAVGRVLDAADENSADEDSADEDSAD